MAAGNYPDLVTAARNVSYTPDTFTDKVVFTVEVTSTDYVTIREVDLLCDVVAGRDKTAERDALICPFFDAIFATDGTLMSAAHYQVAGGAKTAIPAIYGTDIADRVRSFSLSFDSAGEKRITLFVTDDTGDLNEVSDSLIVRVN